MSTLLQQAQADVEAVKAKIVASTDSPFHAELVAAEAHLKSIFEEVPTEFHQLETSVIDAFKSWFGKSSPAAAPVLVAAVALPTAANTVGAATSTVAGAGLAAIDAPAAVVVAAAPAAVPAKPFIPDPSFYEDTNDAGGVTIPAITGGVQYPAGTYLERRSGKFVHFQPDGAMVDGPMPV